jgi:DNA primase
MSVVDDVKQKVDIVDVIGQFVTLKKAGRNFKALCPFHNEKTPSFVVYPDQGRWHCFGACATGGDAFTFLMKRENIDFGEALKRLALRAGVELIREGPGEDAERKKLREILAQAAAHYHYLLKNHPAAQAARDYLARRFVDAPAIEQFELGYSLDEWEALRSFLVGKGFTSGELEAAGLVILGDRGTHYDRFRGRLMFPIRSRSGEVVGFGARTLSGEEPKYLNSPQTPLFDKSGTLYGLDVAKDSIRERNLAVIVEGYMDVIGAHQAGFTNVVASLGTALTEKQLGLLKRLTNRYALALDPDAAGEQATIRGLQVAREALGHKTVPVPIGAGLVGFEQRLEAELLVISMPPGQDPDELIHGDPARWNELVDAAEPLVDFNFRVLTQDLDLTVARDKSVAVKRLVPIIREIGDPVQQAHYAQRLARLVQVPEQTIAQQIGAHPARRSAPTAASADEAADASLPRGEQVLEEYCLMLALRSPEHLPQIDFLEPGDYADPSIRAVFFALVDAQSQADESFESDSVRDSLDPALVPLFDQLTGRAQQLPLVDEADSARDIQTAAYRLRLQRDRAELAKVEVLLRDEAEEDSAQDRLALRERVEFLRKRINFSQKALSARTLFKPHSYRAGFG